MRFAPTLVHAIADYVVGIIVAVLPLYLGLSARMTFIALGIAVICYSLLTDYELGLVRFLRIRFDPLLDALFGVAMLAAPSLLHLTGRDATIAYVIGALALVLTSRRGSVRKVRTP
jgi:hypothetical protein